MAKEKLFITEERMLQLMDYAIQKGIVENGSDFMERIGSTKYNLSHVRTGRQGFSKVQILNACKLTGASADFIFGLSDTLKIKTKKTLIS